jgi:TonB-dependent starch-binding outer membrane protein SusC
MSKLRRILGLALAVLGAAPGLLAAQTRQITGQVVRSGSGAAIADAVIAVAGTMTSVQTDAEGRFTITAPGGEVRLTARAIGFTRKDAIVPANVSTVNFTLDPDVFRLEEVVVSGQATTVERRNLTSSVGYVSGEDVSKVASPTIESALYGKLAGVNIQSNSGAPGGGIQLQIRGSNTILGNFDPLFVVDGVIYSNARVLGGRASLIRGASITEDDPVNRLADLNPADIASIEVLKGAAAAAIYGSKAAAGVVIVKTIRGQGGAPQVNLSQRVGTFSLLRSYKPHCWASIADAVAAYGTLAQAYLGQRGLDCFSHYDQVWGGERASYETVADVSGGDENTKYFASATWKRDNAIEPGTGFGRQALRINLDQVVGSKFSVSVSSVFNRAFHERGWGNNCNNYGCYGYALAYVPSYVDLRKQADGSYINPRTAAGSAPASNPLQTAELSRNQAETFRFTGGATVTWNAYAGERSSFRLIGTAGADLFTQNDDLLAPADLYWQQQEARPGASIENLGLSRLLNWNINGVHQIRTGGIQFTTSGGLQFESNWLKTTRITTTNLLPGQENVNQGTNFVPAEFLTRDRTLAFYATEEAQLLGDRLLIAAGVRAERSSTNGDVDKYYFYPRVSGKYTIREALGSGSELKLRAGYGELGNLPRFGDKFTLLGTPTFGGQIGLAVSTTAGDATIEPERLKEIEAGFDMIFWGGRANLDVTVFRRQTTNLLLSRTPAPSTGFAAQIFNGGQISNKGLEVVLGVTPVQRRNFGWVSSTSFSVNRSNVDSLPVPRFRPPGSGFGGLGVLLVEQGKPLTRLFGPRYFRPGEDPDNLKPAACVAPPSRACVIQADAGDTEPDFRLGLSNSFTYKSVSLSVTVDYQQGGTVNNLTQFLLDDGKTTEDFGSDAHTKRITTAFQHGAITDAYFEPATFVKVREISFNWLLPRKWSQGLGLGIRDARLGITGRDLLWFMSYSGLDSEVANFGANPIRSNVDVTPYPPSRSVFINLAVGF